MTDIARRDEVSVAHIPSSIEQWALDASKAHSVAQSLSQTMFIPQSLRGKPAEITAAILTGKEMGLQPMAALRSLDVIQGTPAFRANTLRGLVQAHGHEIWVESTTDTRCVVKGRRKGSEHEESATWTIDRARNMGLTSKDNWKKQPAAMLVARATTEVARRIAADVILALPYSSEELSDESSDATPVVKRTRRAVTPAAPVDEPPLEETAAPVAQTEDPPTWPEVAEPELDYGDDGAES